VLPGSPFIETLHRMPFNPPGQDVAKPGMEFDIIELGPLDQGGHDDPAAGATVAAANKQILSSQGQP